MPKNFPKQLLEIVAIIKHIIVNCVVSMASYTVYIQTNKFNENSYFR